MSGIYRGANGTGMPPYFGGENWSLAWGPPNKLPGVLVKPEPTWTSLWPSRNGLVGQDITAANAWLMPLTWEWPTPDPGNGGYKMLTGVTRDQGGNPVPNVPVDAYRVTDGIRESSTISDATGTYILWVRTSGQYFVAGFLAGAPDRQGVTDDNLTGV
jgi:hypothetical protein